MVVVVIKPDFSIGYDFAVFRETAEFIIPVVLDMFDLVRMDSD